MADNCPYISEDDWQWVKSTLEDYGRELAIASTFLRKLDKSLFGNGQPGLIQRLEERVDNLEKISHVQRGAMNQRKTDIANIVKIIGIVGGALGIWGHILGLGVHVK